MNDTETLSWHFFIMFFLSPSSGRSMSQPTGSSTLMGSSYGPFPYGHHFPGSSTSQASQSYFHGKYVLLWHKKKGTETSQVSHTEWKSTRFFLWWSSWISFPFIDRYFISLSFLQSCLVLRMHCISHNCLDIIRDLSQSQRYDLLVLTILLFYSSGGSSFPGYGGVNDHSPTASPPSSSSTQTSALTSSCQQSSCLDYSSMYPHYGQGTAQGGYYPQYPYLSSSTVPLTNGFNGSSINHHHSSSANSSPTYQSVQGTGELGLLNNSLSVSCSLRTNNFTMPDPKQTLTSITIIPLRMWVHHQSSPMDMK